MKKFYTRSKKISQPWFSYHAYGMGIMSALPFPELENENIGTGVVIRLGRVEVTPPALALKGTSFWATKNEVCLLYKKIGAFLVRGGREIIVDPAPEVEEGILRLFVLGPALGVLLHQRGRLILHGSAVTTKGDAIAFLGEEESGKSTLAAALFVSGHSVVADDVVALHPNMGTPLVFPAFPRLKLWPNMAASLGDFGETQEVSYPHLEIRAYSVKRGFSAEPIPLRQIYVLEESESPKIELLKPQEALMELVKHSYCVRLLSNGRASSHFLQCSTLVNHIPIFRLNRPRSLTALPDVVRMVEEDLAHV